MFVSIEYVNSVASELKIKPILQGLGLVQVAAIEHWPLKELKQNGTEASIGDRQKMRPDMLAIANAA